MKHCAGCSLTKPLSGFNRKGSGHQARCRECQAIAFRAGYTGAARERALGRVKSRNSASRLRNLSVLAGLKDRPCADCGVKYNPWQMDFDHVANNKTANVSALAGRGSVTQVILEAGKCELVCSNCHRDRTHRRQRSGHQ